MSESDQPRTNSDSFAARGGVHLPVRSAINTALYKKYPPTLCREWKYLDGGVSWGLSAYLLPPLEVYVSSCLDRA